MCCHKLKNKFLTYLQADANKKVVFVRLFTDDGDKDFKVEANGSCMTVTDCETSEETNFDVESWDLIHNSLIKMQTKGNEKETLQFLG